MISVTPKTKLSTLATKDNIIIRFVLDGCTFCEQSQNDWDKAVKNANLTPHDAMVQVDSTKENKIKEVIPALQNYTISGYPTMLHISGTMITPIGRSTSDILAPLTSLTSRKSRKSRKGGWILPNRYKRICRSKRCYDTRKRRSLSMVNGTKALLY